MDRGKSLRRKQSAVEMSRFESPQPAEDLPQRSDNSGSPAPGFSPVAARLQRNNPLPTPDKEDFYRTNPNYVSPTIEISADSQTYRFPTPSPRSSPRDYTGQLAPPAHGIGIALGSPRQHLPQHIQESPRNFSPSHPSPLRTLSEPLMTASAQFTAPSAMAEVPKLRKSKSRTFRNVFSKAVPSIAKATERQPSPLMTYNQILPMQSGTDMAYQNALPSMQKPGMQNPGYTHAGPLEAQTGFQPQMRTETGTMHPGYAQEIASQQSKLAAGPRPAPPPIQIKPSPYLVKKGNYTEIKVPEMYHHTVLVNQLCPNPPITQNKPNTAVSAPPMANSSLLDVPIPGSDMERYSVMFEKLLKPATPSLAERRGTTSRLRPLAEEPPMPALMPAVIHRRRATSPVLPSPDIVQKSIAATNQSHKEAAERLMRIRRTNTAPAGALKPLPPSQISVSQTLRELREPSPTSPSWSEPSLPLTPTFSEDDGSDTRHRDDHTKIRDSNDSASAPGSRQRMDSLTDVSHETKQVESFYHRSDHHAGVRRLQNHHVVAQGYANNAVNSKSANVGNGSRAQQNRHIPITVKQPLRPRLVDPVLEAGARTSTMATIEHA